jgi:hypothetical protein
MMSRRAAGIVLAYITVILILPTADADEQLVTWTNVVNVTITDNVLQKTGGWDGVDDAGATSVQELTAGDGYVEFTVGEATTFWLAGLSHGNDGTGYADIDFAFRFNGAGWADVLENGVYQSGGDTAYAAGDVFRVAVVGGRVQYSRNGLLLRESAAVPQYPLVLDTSLGSLGTTVHNAMLGVSPPPPPGGGLIETAGSPGLRPRFTPQQIAAFLPANGAPGPFTFPTPYNTTGIRLTSASDCAGGADCLWYAGYSYWRNINNHAGSADMYIFLGTDRNRGGVGPILLRYNKVTDDVQNLGALFDGASPYSFSTGEGWYFSATRPTALYTFLVGQPQLRRYDVVRRQFDSVPALDLRGCPRRVCPSAAAFITQPHSSDNDLVHSATVQTADWVRIGCVVYQSALRRFRYYGTPAGYVFDECHVDKSGQWVLLHESRVAGGRRSRVVELSTGRITAIDDVNGALGHLDMGFGYAVGADTYSPLPNATILLKFPVTGTERPIGPVVHYNKRWDLAAANHVAHGNARSGIPAESQYACGSNASRVADMADEIVCFSLDPAGNADGSLSVVVVAQVMTSLDAPGGGDVDGDDYEQTPKGNLDVTGRYFLWTTNLGGDRLDAFLVKIPAERFGDAAASSQSQRGRRGSLR